MKRKSVFLDNFLVFRTTHIFIFTFFVVLQHTKTAKSLVLIKNVDIQKTKVESVMQKRFKTINERELIVEAAAKMKKHKVYNLVVEYKNNIVGVISMHDILEANVL